MKSFPPSRPRTIGRCGPWTRGANIFTRFVLTALCLSRLRHAKQISQYATMKAPTGVGEANPVHILALEADRLIQEKVHSCDVDDDEDVDVDNIPCESSFNSYGILYEFDIVS